MTQQYRLSCSQCENSQLVETRHAGSSIHCSNCETVIVVPKLRELKQLEPVGDDNRPPQKRGWNQLSGGLFALGLLALVIALGSLYYVHGVRKYYGQFTTQPKVEDLRFPLDINAASLTDSWRVWEQLLERKEIVDRETPSFVRMRDEVKRLDFWSKFFYSLATVGLLAMLTSPFLRPLVDN